MKPRELRTAADYLSAAQEPWRRWKTVTLVAHNSWPANQCRLRRVPRVRDTFCITAVLLTAGASYGQAKLGCDARDICELILPSRSAPKVWLGCFQLLSPPGVLCRFVGVSGSNGAEPADDATGGESGATRKPRGRLVQRPER